jgi:predicted phage gp36 major capsid-like protein
LGAAGNFAETNPQDRLIDMVHALASPYRQGAVWVMNSATLARIRPERCCTGKIWAGWPQVPAMDRSCWSMMKT